MNNKVIMAAVLQIILVAITTFLILKFELNIWILAIIILLSMVFFLAAPFHKAKKVSKTFNLLVFIFSIFMMLIGSLLVIFAKQAGIGALSVIPFGIFCFFVGVPFFLIGLRRLKSK